MKKLLIILGVVLGVSTVVHAQVVINEICPANADINYDPTYFNYSGWIELYNPGSGSVNIGGYYLSDDPAQKNKWRIPSGTSLQPKGYLLIWCDGLGNGTHTNFSLDSDGEELIFSTAALAMVDEITFPEQFTNISYGRLSNGGATWGYMSVPTPNAANNPATGTTQLSKPDFSIDAGRYAGTQAVAITHNLPGVQIRYTVDGSEPTSGSMLYTTPVSIGSTRSLKAKAFKEGSLPSKTETATYFINEHAFTIPVVSITTKSAYLWDTTIGIYVEGTNGVTGNCNGNRVNWNQDWDRHAVFEYFDAQGNRLLDQHIDIRIGGACSRNQPQKSFVVKARDKYGSKTIDYKLFPNKDIDEFGGFILRNSGNDFNLTMFRDALIQHLTVGQMDIDYLDYQPTAFYLNGQYWGIQNLREKIDADYIEANYGVDQEDLDLIETWWLPLEGSLDAYSSYQSTLSSMDRSTSEAFEYISEHIDVQEYINYQVTQIYVANTDWPGNNVKFWRQRSANGKFRWIMWDLDFGFALYEGASWATHPTLEFATDPDNTGWPNPDWSTLHFRLVLENPEFRKRFIETMLSAMNTTFAPDRVNAIIDEFRERIVAEMPYHKTRWGGDMNSFEWEVNKMRNFATARNNYMRTHVAQFFGLPESVTMSITAQPVGGGTFKLNTVTSDVPSVSASYSKGVGYTVEPAPAPGYKFKQWRITRQESTAIPLIERGDTWKYYDQAGSPGATWAATGFNDTPWSTGIAQFGYGEGDEQTVISFGADGNNKHITSYYRKTFTIADTVGLDVITGESMYDDGIVIYLNGTEVHRANMPLGAITNTTLASQAIPSENNWVGFVIPKGIIVPGTNVLAVEVHQNAANSSDVSFDLSMRTVRLGNVSSEMSTTPLQTGTAFSDLLFEATYEIDTRVISGLVINEVNASPSTVTDNAGDAEDWIEIFNNGSQTVNLAGLYITDNITQKKKHKIVSGTGDEMMLPPGGYKVFWADEEMNEGPDHLNFKLSNEGEVVALYQELDGVLNQLAVFEFGEQFGRGSFSRIPNATGPIVFTADATPGASNNYVTAIEQDEVPGVYPNPVGPTLFIKSNYRIEQADIVDLYGKTVRTFDNLLPQASLDVADVRPGLYLLRMKSAYGWKVLKIVKD